MELTPTIDKVSDAEYKRLNRARKIVRILKLHIHTQMCGIFLNLHNAHTQTKRVRKFYHFFRLQHT